MGKGNSSGGNSGGGSERSYGTNSQVRLLTLSQSYYCPIDLEFVKGNSYSTGTSSSGNSNYYYSSEFLTFIRGEEM